MKHNTITAVIRIDTILIPITQSLMESAQIIVVFAVLAQVFANTYTGSPFALPSFFAINLGQIWVLQWIYSRNGREQKYTRFFEVIVYIAVFLLLSAASLNAVFTDYFWLKEFIIALTVAILWRTHIISGGKKHTAAQQTTFLIGFGAFVFATIVAGFNGIQLTNFILQLFPIFALSGLITISLTRLTILQKKLINRSAAEQSLTMRWLLLTSLISLALLILSLLFDSLISINMLDAVTSFFMPLWDVIGVFALVIGIVLAFSVEIIFYPVRWVIYFLESLLHKGNQQITPPSGIQLKSIPDVVSSQQTITLIQYILIALLAMLTIYIVLRILKTTFNRTSTADYEDIHEHLAISSETSKKYGLYWPYDSTKIDESSVRARYRELLEYIQKKHPRLARNMAETPLEYKRRLQATLNKEEEPARSATQAALQALTNAYRQERYGKLTADDTQKKNARAWAKQVTEHFPTI